MPRSDARRGMRMFKKVRVRILGIVENMSTCTCPHCGKSTDIFRRGGGERMSRQLEVPFLGAVPLDADVVTCDDEGHPVVVDKPKSVTAQAYAAIAAALAEQLHAAPATVLKPFVWTWDSNERAPAWMEEAVRPSGSRTTAIGLRRRDARTLSAPAYEPTAKFPVRIENGEIQMRDDRWDSNSPPRRQDRQVKLKPDAAR